MARKSISKKLRFEVFKRDSFTCQYCGQMAPDVVLELDHINPVVNGGNNDILNLVTACMDCNRGKGKRKLTDKDEIKKQQEQLKNINANREQLKMMIEWKEQLAKFEDEQVDIIESLIAEYGNSLTEVGRNKFKIWINKYGFNEVYETFELSLNQYLKDDDINKSIGKAIDYVPRIITNRAKAEKDPCLKEMYYIRGILRNRGMIYNEKTVWAILKECCFDQDSCELVKDMAKTADNWTEFKNWIQDTFRG